MRHLKIPALRYPELRSGYAAEMHRRRDLRLDLEDGLLETHHFVEQLLRTEAEPFRRRPRPDGLVEWEQASPLGLMANRRLGSTLTPEFIARFDVSPHIQAFRECAALFGVPPTDWHPRDIIAGKTLGERFNLVAQAVRNRASNPAFNRKFAVRRAGVLADCASASELVYSISSTTRHVIVSRFDLSYSEFFRASARPDHLKRHLRKLLNNWRKHESGRVQKGYMWKLQYGSVTGYYVHFIYLRDAGRTDISFNPIEQVGLIWRSVTDGAGQLDQVKADNSIFAGGCGLWDRESRRAKAAALLQGIYYLLQKDQFFRVRMGLAPRLYGRSEIRRT